MTDFIFSDMFQLVVFVTRKGGADVAKEFLLAVVARWALSMFRMIFSLEKSSSIYLVVTLAITIFVSSHVLDRNFFVFEGKYFSEAPVFKISTSISNG